MIEKEIQGASPWFGDDHEIILREINEILKSGQLVNGKHSKRFESELRKMANTKYALAVNSGGTALELALLSLEIKNKEVILPAQTFIASANAIKRAGGIPVFADIDKDTNCLDYDAVKKCINNKTAGIMFVHMFGLLSPIILKIKKLCSEMGIFLIEDAAHAHGASLNGLMAGSIGDVGCFSFFATKVVTTGEGGARYRSGTKVRVQKRNIVKGVDLSVSSTLGGDLEQRQEMNVDYNINDNISIQGVYETRENEEQFDETTDSIGADLKLRWSF